MAGLYIHVPFCVRKCLYCDFYSEEEPGASIARRLQRERPSRSRFLAALDRELARLPEGFAPTTLFIGGGTPTELSPEDFALLLAQLRQRVDLSRVTEWSCEANPGTLTEKHAVLMKEAGINRVSLGVQSFHPEALRFLGRIHDPGEAVAAFRLLRRFGFDNLNLDLIYAIPGFGLDVTAADLQRVLELEPEHVACYGLIFEEGTPLDKLCLRGHVSPVDEALEEQQYSLVRETLASAGWERYEISNYARPGKTCRHNAPEDRAREILLMTLRQAEGVDLYAFHQRTGYTVEALCGSGVETLCGQGLLERRGHRLRLAEKALFVSDAVLAELAG